MSNIAKSWKYRVRFLGLSWFLFYSSGMSFLCFLQHYGTNGIRHNYVIIKYFWYCNIWWWLYFRIDGLSIGGDVISPIIHLRLTGENSLKPRADQEGILERFVEKVCCCFCWLKTQNLEMIWLSESKQVESLEACMSFAICPFLSLDIKLLVSIGGDQPCWERGLSRVVTKVTEPGALRDL